MNCPETLRDIVARELNMARGDNCKAVDNIVAAIERITKSPDRADGAKEMKVWIPKPQTNGRCSGDCPLLRAKSIELQDYAYEPCHNVEYDCALHRLHVQSSIPRPCPECVQYQRGKDESP